MNERLTYIFGHKNPDTDSVCAAIALSHLKNQMGMNTTPAVLGAINNETTSTLLCNFVHVSNNKFIQCILYSSGNACITHSSK